MTIFKSTSRFQEAVALINNITSDSFDKILSRVIKRLESNNGVIFNDEEKTQLQELLGLAVLPLETIIDGCAYIFQTAAYRLVSAIAIEEQLQEVGMIDRQAAAFSAVWGKSGDSLVTWVRQRCMGAPQVLTDSSWRLQLQMGQSKLSQLKDPCVLMEIVTAKPSSTAHSGDGEPDNERTVMEFTHAELSDFFMKLECIQEQLDTLG